MHALLVSVESTGDRLAGTATFQNHSTFTLFWAQKNEQMDAIAAATESAIGLARLSLPAN